MDKVLSKKEILDKYLDDSHGAAQTYRDIQKAMEEYANQEKRIEAIEYQKWLTLFGWEISTNHPEKWYKWDVIPHQYKTYEQVYSEFKKYQQSIK